MNTRYEMRFTGSGGQGVILASVILAEAAVCDGKQAIQSQSYGPEARGGLCKAEAIVSKEQIWFSKVRTPNMLLALNQGSLDKYAPDIADDAIVIIDSSLTPPDYLDPERLVAIPIIKTADEKVGKVMTANIVAVGAINKLLGLFSEEALKEGIKRHIPAGTEKINHLARVEGEALITDEMAEKFKQAID